MLKKHQVHLLHHMICREGKKQYGNAGIDNLSAQRKFALYIFSEIRVQKQA